MYLNCVRTLDKRLKEDPEGDLYIDKAYTEGILCHLSDFHSSLTAQIHFSFSVQKKKKLSPKI